MACVRSHGLAAAAALRRGVGGLLFLGLLESALAMPVHIPIPGLELGIGTIKTIGMLSADVTADGNASGRFTLGEGFRSLMSDAEGREFRFYQVITYDDEPVKWNNAIIAPAGSPDRSLDVVDVPSGGWDYQRDPTNTSCTNKGGGDDDAPFYESDTANGYCFPGLSYPALHAADGVDPGFVETSDQPGLNAANHKTLFMTFLAYEDPALRGHGIINLLGGYSWGVMTDATGAKSGIAASPIHFASLDNALLHELADANARSGYDDWLVFANYVSFVDEPSVLALLLVPLAGLGGARIRRRRTR